jgi:hypothetical protein
MLLSPANLSGRRGQMLLNPAASFALAQQLRSAQGAPLGDLFSFVSGLYFRGKREYARAFAHAADGALAGFVMTAGGGLCSLDEAVSVERLRGWAGVSIHEQNLHFTAPLVRQASALLEASDERMRFVLLGSVASNKYVAPLLDVFGERLLYPRDFRGMGDMSRGSLLLSAVRQQRELEYEPVAELSRS